MISSADFSECRQYRYCLTRTWNRTEEHVLFVGLNPSTADEADDDPTIRRCIDFAQRWGFGGMRIVNLFAYRTKDPQELMKTEHPLGMKNNQYLKKWIKNSKSTVLIWGRHGKYLNRNDFVINIIEHPLCIKKNKDGSPAHPLYLKKDLKPICYL